MCTICFRETFSFDKSEFYFMVQFISRWGLSDKVHTSTISKNQRYEIMDTSSLKHLPKVDVGLKSQLEGFDTEKLKSASTMEKVILPTAADVAAEKTQQNLFAGIAAFDTAKLKHADTQEKNPLPDKAAIELEKEKNKFISGIENFDSTKLKHTQTCEKNLLPTKEVIEEEKKA